MFIEFETGSGRTLLNVRHIVQVKRFQDLSDAITEIILANGGVVTVAGSYQDVCDNPVAHHDALEFPDGQVVLVTRSCDGQWQPRASRTCREGCDCGRGPRSGCHNPEDHAALGKGCCLKPLHSTPRMCSVDDIAAAPAKRKPRG
jgi:hypothetical protein